MDSTLDLGLKFQEKYLIQHFRYESIFRRSFATAEQLIH